MCTTCRDLLCERVLLLPQPLHRLLCAGKVDRAVCRKRLEEPLVVLQAVHDRLELTQRALCALQLTHARLPGPCALPEDGVL